MSNPFRVPDLAKENQYTRYYSDRQEKAVAKAVGGTQTKNSGATLFGGKSDVHTDNWTFECKTKTSNCDSISIKKSWIDKLNREKIADQKRYSAVVFNFGPDHPYNENHYIINENLFQRLLEYLSKEDNEI